MAVSGTYNFNLDIDQVIQEATEMIGGEDTLGHTPESARRSINLMLRDWQNRGILLWTTSTTAVTVTSSVADYSLSSSTINVLEATTRRDNTDIKITRITPEEYLLIPAKTQTGRASQYSIRRGRDNPVMSIWPIPENSTDILRMEIVSEVEDVDKSAIQNADTPKRFLPALTCGLAYYLSMKRTPPLASETIWASKIAMLKTNYEEMLGRAMEEDRERASIYLLPRLTFYN